MSKSTTIECPTCAGQGVYCDDCLSTGSITVVGPVAVFVEELHSQLAAATARAEAAEADAADDAVPVEAVRSLYNAACRYLPFEHRKDAYTVRRWLDALSK